MPSYAKKIKSVCYFRDETSRWSTPAPTGTSCKSSLRSRFLNKIKDARYLTAFLTYFLTYKPETLGTRVLHSTGTGSLTTFLSEDKMMTLDDVSTSKDSWYRSVLNSYVRGLDDRSITILTHALLHLTESKLMAALWFDKTSRVTGTVNLPSRSQATGYSLRT
jgi:hypothetical protein